MGKVPGIVYCTIATHLLARNGSGTLSRAQLENLCILTAQRISRLQGIETPEFLDRGLFRQFIGELGKFGILSKEIRHGIMRVALQPIPEQVAD